MTKGLLEWIHRIIVIISSPRYKVSRSNTKRLVSRSNNYCYLIGAICYAELGCMLKESGGDYTYQRIGLGNPIGYMYGWQTIVALKPSSSAIIALTCSEYILSGFTDDGCGKAPDVMTKILAIAVICKDKFYGRV